MLPDIDEMPRVATDIVRCIRFIAQQPWGKPAERRRDIARGFLEIRRGPELNEISARRPRIGLELRRHNAAQFAIIYAYVRPSSKYPNGAVSIRAVRHARVKNVFSGVKEPQPAPYSAATTGPSRSRLLVAGSDHASH
jgi:hypothetical protein